jgi:hypothetical protein
MTLQFSLTVSDNLQIFGFFLLKSVSRAKNSIWTSGVNEKIIHFTPSVHNILFFIKHVVSSNVFYEIIKHAVNSNLFYNYKIVK